MNGDLAVIVDRVSKKYGEHNVLALNDVSLSVQCGTFIALMGPSGCGKSTLLNCIGGIDVPTSGSINIDGQNIAAMTEAQLTDLRRRKVGLVFQSFNLLPTLTVKENVELPLELAGDLSVTEMAKRSAALLEEVGLGQRAGFYPSQLSGGEMQRVAVVRSLIHHPRIILADEPTGNLDTENGNTILTLLRSLSRDRGETILMATHSEEAAAFADVIVRMRDGRIVEHTEAA